MGKYKTAVAATTYNLAGDVDLRPNILKSLVLNKTLSGTEGGLGKTLLEGLSGTLTGDRRFYRNNFTSYPYRINVSSIVTGTDLDPTVIYPQVRTILGLTLEQELKIEFADIDNVNLGYFVEDWLRANRPDLLATNWEPDLDDVTNEVIITPEAEADIRFAAPADLLWVAESTDRRLLYIVHRVGTRDPNTLLYNYTGSTLLTYRMESGNVALDALDGFNVNMSDFFPIIPIRVNNTWVDDPSFEATYSDIVGAYRDLTGSARIENLLADLQGNTDVENDVDHVYIVKGVDLTTPENVGKQYLYEFFKYLGTLAPQSDQIILDNFVSNQDFSNESYTNYSNITNTFDDPNYGELLADNQVLSEYPPVKELILEPATDAWFKYRITWSSIDEREYVGNFNYYLVTPNPEDAVTGEYAVAPGTAVKTYPTLNGTPVEQDIESLFIFHQYEKYRFRRIKVTNPIHYNYAYKTKAVITNLADAFAEESDQSGFIVPLHYPTWKTIPFSKRAQLVTSSSYLVLNSYKRKKIPWYARGFFKILLVIVIIVVVVVNPSAFASATGLLGSNAAVGAAIGLTGAAAVVGGAIANYIAAMIVSQVISMGATEIFGEKLGAIVGTIALLVTGQGMQSWVETGTFSIDWNSWLRAENLLQLTNAVGDAYTNYLALDTAEIYEKMGELENEYADQFAEVERRTREILGMTSQEIDPMILTEASEYFGESSELFLSRTLLTGTEISELSFAMIHDFASISLELPLST